MIRSKQLNARLDRLGYNEDKEMVNIPTHDNPKGITLTGAELDEMLRQVDGRSRGLPGRVYK